MRVRSRRFGKVGHRRVGGRGATLLVLGLAATVGSVVGPMSVAADPASRPPLRDTLVPGAPGAAKAKADGTQATPAPATGPASTAPAVSEAPSAPPPLTAADRKKAIEAELDAITGDVKLGKEREAEIRLGIEALEKDRVRLAEQMIAAAGRMKTLETELSDREARIGKIAEDEARIRASLAKRRAVLADVLAALQRIGRKPPPAVVVRPEDALASVRSAILIGAVLPELRHEAEALVADLESFTKLRNQATAERDRFKADATALAEERTRLETLLAERRKAQGEEERRLADERRKADELAQKAGSLRDLIAKTEVELESSRKGAEAARKADDERAAKAEPKPDQKTVTAALGDAGRLQPAVPFPDALGLLPMPVGGPIIKQFGEDDGAGGAAKGVSIATRPEARVTSPCDGWVMFAGPFRSYGKLLIINGGGGYHVVLAGMERIDVISGQFVLAGEPVGVMGQRHATGADGTTTGAATTAGGAAGRIETASAGPVAIGPAGGGQATGGQAVGDTGATATGSQQSGPVLYVEFRKGNTSIDPAPWWARSRDEKVRG